MTRVRNTWLTLTVLAAMTTACGESGGNNDGMAVLPDSGADKPDSSATAGGNDAMTPGVLPDASECGAREDGTPLDTSALGGCYYFGCYQTEETLRAQATEGGCANDIDVAITCEGESVRTVAECARENGIALAGGDTAGVVACARKNKKLEKLSDACLNCNVQSSYCAAQKCLAVCVMGDSIACDDCRERNGCTPEFYVCAGLPDPNK